VQIIAVLLVIVLVLLGPIGETRLVVIQATEAIAPTLYPSLLSRVATPISTKVTLAEVIPAAKKKLEPPTWEIV
jgi:hypothetical protein